jgi:hypothetical protein
MLHGPVLGGVDGLATQHGIASVGDPTFGGKRDERIANPIVPKMLGQIAKHHWRVDGEGHASLRMIMKRLP